MSCFLCDTTALRLLGRRLDVLSSAVSATQVHRGRFLHSKHQLHYPAAGSQSSLRNTGDHQPHAGSSQSRAIGRAASQHAPSVGSRVPCVTSARSPGARSRNDLSKGAASSRDQSKQQRSSPGNDMSADTAWLNEIDEQAYTATSEKKPIFREGRMKKPRWRRETEDVSAGNRLGSGGRVRGKAIRPPPDDEEQAKRERKQQELWGIQKSALERKFGDEAWSPRKRLSPDALEGIRTLHAQHPDQYTTPVLSQHFKVSPDAIRRILKSKWRPNDEEEEDRKLRWEKRGEKIWSQMVEIGIKPPKKWREKGIVRTDGHLKRERLDHTLEDFEAQIPPEKTVITTRPADAVRGSSMADRIL